VGWLQLLVVVLVLALSVRLVFQPDPQDDLRQADALFLNGQYYAALQEYTHLAETHETASVMLRLGIIHSLRNEYVEAESALRRGLWLGLEGESHALASLYLGQVLREYGMVAEAERGRESASAGLVSDRSSDRSSPLAGVAQVLQAEWDLRQGRYEAASTAYNTAMQYSLPSDWRELATYRQALLQAATNPDGALRRLQEGLGVQHTRVADAGSIVAQAWGMRSTQDSTLTVPPQPFLSPLLPDIRADTEQLMTVLRADDAHRPQLLGQFYLHLALYELAEQQFDQMASGTPERLDAEAYIAYTRWRMGNRDDSLAYLEALVRMYPDRPHTRVLLTLAYLSQDNLDAARNQIAILTRRYPDLSDVYIAWAHWYTAHGEYEYASEGYRRALMLAPSDEKGSYALLQARFHLDTGYEMCRDGLPASERALDAYPDSAVAWTLVAALRYYCQDLPGTVDAAHAALVYGAGAEASYYLGLAHIAMGDYRTARHALVRAADMNPASVWRERAETELAWLE
jgi:tetratricopeptide (TPR) repeat protein